MRTIRTLRCVWLLFGILALAGIPPAPAQGTSHYASPDGTPGGDGSFERPWDLATARCQNVTMSGNTFYGRIAGFTAPQFPDNTYYTKPPQGALTVVRPNQYELGRAHIIIYNWDLLDTVEVDVSDLGLTTGEPYEIRNVQNYDEGVDTGVYDGNPIKISMTDLTVTDPIGYEAPPSTLPEFGVFILTVGSKDSSR